MVIGITGGIGSGKSTIAQELVRRGYYVYDCDKEAKRIITENEAVRKSIIALLGTEAFLASPNHPFTGRYNTAYVAQRVFAEPQLLEKLNAIVHPAVKEDICQRSGLSGEAGLYSIRRSRSIFIESAILYEAGLDAICDKIFVVDAPEEIRIERTIARDYHGEATEENIDKVRARIRAQKAVTNYQSPITDHPSPVLLLNDGLTPIDDLVAEILKELRFSTQNP